MIQQGKPLQPLAKGTGMDVIQTLTAQHQDLLAISSRVSRGLDTDSLRANAAPVRTAVSELAGVLKVHLTMEDRSLYPSLLNHQDPKIHATARNCVDEMGGLFEKLQAFLAKWPNPVAVQQNPEEFVRDLDRILEALAYRIKREESQLFPLLASATP